MQSAPAKRLPQSPGGRAKRPGWRLLAAVAGAMLAVFGQAQAADRAAVLDIQGVIGPAMADYVTRQLAELNPTDTRLVILRMNTPGGLDSSMREIIRAILASPIPVVTYVAPSGARAASAGTYIAYASPIVAMAPGTNIGAATPVQLGGSSPLPGGGSEQPSSSSAGDAESRKAVNDAAAFIRSLAEANGHNADWAETAVRSAASVPASQAVKLHVADLIAADIPDLLRQIDGRTVLLAGKPAHLATAGLEVVVRPPDWRTQLLGALTDPNVAFILLLIGIYGLIFEFLNPGMVAPGLIGAICLLVGLFALSLLPIDYAGAGLLLLGVALIIAEVHIGAFGALGVGGVAAFTIGAIMMFPSGAPGFHLSLWLAGAAALVSASFFMLGLSLLVRSRQRPVVTGKEALLGALGETVSWERGEGRVRLRGEIWQARGAGPLAPGARVRVVAREGLTLIVEPA
ncbi:MAG TPA: nodulation protein NfeD [Dongiaceae bacterium]|nr:nodulation protein NfeD [Dongiaceae bacterium]